MSTYPELVLAVVLVTATSVQSSIHSSGAAEDRLSLRVSPLVSFDPGFIEIDISSPPGLAGPTMSWNAVQSHRRWPWGRSLYGAL